jgi:microcystin-dependent protein
MEPFIGEIRLVGFTYAPQGWAFCDGQVLAIAQNTTLFSLLGTTYGGDGQTTFALPDLRGRVAVGRGTGAGLSTRSLGETAGSESRTLLTSNLPAHTHAVTATVRLPATNARATTNRPVGAVPAAGGSYAAADGTAPNTPAEVTDGAVGISGGSQPFDVMPPYLGSSYIIALEGIYPTRP